MLYHQKCMRFFTDKLLWQPFPASYQYSLGTGLTRISARKSSTTINLSAAKPWIPITVLQIKNFEAISQQLHVYVPLVLIVRLPTLSKSPTCFCLHYSVEANWKNLLNQHFRVRIEGLQFSPIFITQSQ